jgi:leucine dehydrogenase
MVDVFAHMQSVGAHRLLVLADAETGLRAIIALDDLTLGPACGGVRTKAYADLGAAMEDAAALARAMTLKCAIAGLPAGGGKTVVMDHPGMDRARAFQRLGAYVEDLGGLYRCAGDLGTTQDDLLEIAKFTRHVNTTGVRLGDATALTVMNGIRACADHRGVGLQGLRIAVQGCGLIGAGVARAAARAGAQVFVADVDASAANALAGEIHASILDPQTVLLADVDIIAPCAVGGVVTPAAADAIKAWAICGGANNQLSGDHVAERLHARGILFIPDFLASSGAVIDGVSAAITGLPPEATIEATYDTARALLATTAADGITPLDAARGLARARIAEAQKRRTETHA